MDTPYLPELYDLMTPVELSGDVAWYRRLALQACGPVLELAAGTGRVALELVRAGIDLCALDRDPRMLARLTQKHAALGETPAGGLEVVALDMRDFELGRRFALVICPLRSFQHNLEHDEQLACLGAVRRHLEPGGEFALDLSHPVRDFSRFAGDPGLWRWVDERELPGGERVLRSESVRYDFERKRMHSRARFEHCDASGNLLHTHLRALELSYLGASDAEQLLAEAGFDDVRAYGGFDESPLGEDSEVQVIRARRPTGS